MMVLSFLYPPKNVFGGRQQILKTHTGSRRFFSRMYKDMPNRFPKWACLWIPPATGRLKLVVQVGPSFQHHWTYLSHGRYQNQSQKMGVILLLFGEQWMLLVGELQEQQPWSCSESSYWDRHWTEFLCVYMCVCVCVFVWSGKKNPNIHGTPQTENFNSYLEIGSIVSKPFSTLLYFRLTKFYHHHLLLLNVFTWFKILFRTIFFQKISDF